MALMDESAYRRQAQALLPSGRAWSRRPGSWLAALLGTFSAEFARVDDRASQVLDEALPNTTGELLDDWERVAGLPDACLGDTLLQATRREALVAKITAIGGQSRAYYIALAETLGYSITITEFSPHSVDDDVDQLIYGQDWAWAWQINAPLYSVREITVDDEVISPLGMWGNGVLECVMDQRKPAHTTLIFSYS